MAKVIDSPVSYLDAIENRDKRIRLLEFQRKCLFVLIFSETKAILLFFTFGAFAGVIVGAVLMEAWLARPW